MSDEKKLMFVPPPPPAMHGDGRTITITKGYQDGADNTAGIWIGTGRDRNMVAIFSTPDQIGIGIYEKGANGPCGICLHLDNDGAGVIQFADNDGRYVSLGLDDVKMMMAHCQAGSGI
jgi:hypothetical protein